MRDGARRIRQGTLHRSPFALDRRQVGGRGRPMCLPSCLPLGWASGGSAGVPACRSAGLWPAGIAGVPACRNVALRPPDIGSHPGVILREPVRGPRSVIYGPRSIVHGLWSMVLLPGLPSGRAGAFLDVPLALCILESSHGLEEFICLLPMTIACLSRHPVASLTLPLYLIKELEA